MDENNYQVAADAMEEWAGRGDAELSRLIGVLRESSFLRPGERYLIRCITFFYVGEVVIAGPREIVLRDASWIPQTGRYHECLANGAFSEVEPMPGDGICVLNRDAVVDAVPWLHDLPRAAK